MIFAVSSIQISLFGTYWIQIIMFEVDRYLGR